MTTYRQLAASSHHESRLQRYACQPGHELAARARHADARAQGRAHCRALGLSQPAVSNALSRLRQALAKGKFTLAKFLSAEHVAINAEGTGHAKANAKLQTLDKVAIPKRSVTARRKVAVLAGAGLFKVAFVTLPCRTLNAYDLHGILKGKPRAVG